MEKQLMEKIKNILEQDFNLKKVNCYYDLLGNYVVTYVYNGDKFIISNDYLE